MRILAPSRLPRAGGEEDVVGAAAEGVGGAIGAGVEAAGAAVGAVVAAVGVGMQGSEEDGDDASLW